MKLSVMYQFCVNTFQQGIIIFLRNCQRYVNEARNLLVADIIIQVLKYLRTLQVHTNIQLTCNNSCVYFIVVIYDMDSYPIKFVANVKTLNRKACRKSKSEN